LNIGYSLLILINNTTNEANLASAFLVGTSTTTRLLSIDDANSRGSRICAWQVLLELCRVVLAPHTQRSAPPPLSSFLSQGSTAAATIRMRYPGVKLVEISGFDTKSQIPGAALE
jgi:hypothetical protein